MILRTLVSSKLRRCSWRSSPRANKLQKTGKKHISLSLMEREIYKRNLYMRPSKPHISWQFYCKIQNNIWSYYLGSNLHLHQNVVLIILPQINSQLKIHICKLCLQRSSETSRIEMCHYDFPSESDFGLHF